MTSSSRFPAALTVVVILALLLTACADSAGEQTADGASPPSSGAASDGETSDGAASDGTGLVEVSTDARGVLVEGDAEKKPQITLPDAEPPSELVVVDLIEGDGEVVEEGSSVTVQYVGVSWTNDGAEFDSSWDRGQPATFELNQVIPGWTEGIPGMKAGGRRLLIIPPDMAYGAEGRPPAIPPSDTLVFVIDVLPPPEPIQPGTDTFGVEVSGPLDEKPQITLPGGEPPSELVVVDIQEGEGDEIPFGATVTTHYTGVSWTNDGAQFDSSWDRGEPSTFGLGQVIAGWTQGIPGMKAGGRRLLIIPPEMAYGAAGRPPEIPENDTLVFVIDMIGVQ